MFEVKEEDLELLQILHKAETLVNKVKTASSRNGRDSIVEKCQKELKQCKSIMSRIEIETRDMNPEDRSQVRQLLKERATKLKDLKNELKWAKSENNRFENEAYDEKYEDLNEMNEDQIMDYARNIQNEDIEILDRVIIDVDQTKQQAVDVAQKVSDQTDQIQRIGKKVDDIDDELERAKRILRIMLRRVMTDKVIWVFVGLIFFAVCFIVLDKTDVLS
eukprot:159175_1